MKHIVAVKSGLAAGLFVLVGCSSLAEDIEMWSQRGDCDRLELEAVQAEDEETAMMAIRGLGTGRCEESAEALVAWSQNGSPRIRQAAVEAMGAYLQPDVFAAVLRRTADDNKKVSAAADKVFKRWDSRAGELLLDALADRSGSTRLAAARALGRVTVEGAGPALVDVVKKDENPFVRREAIKALGAMNYVQARRDLHHVRFHDDSREVVSEAERVLAGWPGTLCDSTLVIVPPELPTDLAELGTSLYKAFVDGITAYKLAPLVPVPVLPTAGTSDRRLAVMAALRPIADEMIWIEVHRDQDKVAVQVQRYDLQRGTVLQSVSTSGYELQADDLIRNIVMQFVRTY